MKTPTILLLTSDTSLKNSAAEALLKTRDLSHLTGSARDALQLVCTIGQDLDLAVIDCEHGPHGMTLVSAINSRREGFPVIVVTRDGEKHRGTRIRQRRYHMPSQTGFGSASRRCDEAMSPVATSTGACRLTK